MNYAVILSGGVGTRLGLEMPKQYYKVNNKMILQYVTETISNCDFIQGYVIVAAEAWQDTIRESLGDAKFLGFALPGENRQLSIYHGLLALQDVAGEGDVVLIQDAARPNTTEALMKRCLFFDESMDGTMPVLKMKDTVYLSHDGKQVNSLLNRHEIYAGQAPEAFLYGKYLRANQALLPDEILKINGSTEPAIKAGMKIALINGDENNYKVTTLDDLERFKSVQERN